MASDANLIKGAAAAAGGAAKIAGATSGLNMAYSQAMQGAAANLEEKKERLTAAKKRDQEFSDTFAANSEAADLQAGALGEAEYDITQKRIAGLKKQYDRLKLGDDSGRQKILGQLARESQGLTSQKDARVLNAKALKTLRTDVSSEDRHVMGAFANSNSGAYTIDEDASGELTYTFTMPEGSKDSEGNPITEKKMSSAEVQKLYEMQTDAVGAQKTSDMAIAEIDRGKNGEPFDAFKTGASFDTLLKDDNSLMSALHDDWGVGNFSASIDKKIETEIGGLNGKIDFAIEMRDKGIDIPAGEGEDNWYDNVTDEDIALIKERLMNPESDEEKAISRSVAKDYYVDAMEQQNKRGVKQAEDASKAANAKQNNENYQKQLDRESKEKIAKIKEEGLKSRDPNALRNKVYNKTVLPSFNKLKNEMYDPDKGDGKSENISEQDQVVKTLSWLESNVQDMEQIVHRSSDEIKEQYPNAIVPDNMDSFPDNGYYEVVNSTDYRKTMKVNGKEVENPNYGEIVQKLELINEGFQITDINSIRNLLDLDGALADEATGKYNNPT